MYLFWLDNQDGTYKAGIYLFVLDSQDGIYEAQKVVIKLKRATNKKAIPKTIEPIFRLPLRFLGKYAKKLKK